MQTLKSSYYWFEETSQKHQHQHDSTDLKSYNDQLWGNKLQKPICWLQIDFYYNRFNIHFILINLLISQLKLLLYGNGVANEKNIKVHLHFFRNQNEGNKRKNRSMKNKSIHEKIFIAEVKFRNNTRLTFPIHKRLIAFSDFSLL